MLSLGAGTLRLLLELPPTAVKPLHALLLFSKFQKFEGLWIKSAAI